MVFLRRNLSEFKQFRWLVMVGGLQFGKLPYSWNVSGLEFRKIVLSAEKKLVFKMRRVQ